MSRIKIIGGQNDFTTHIFVDDIELQGVYSATLELSANCVPTLNLNVCATNNLAEVEGVVTAYVPALSMTQTLALESVVIEMEMYLEKCSDKEYEDAVNDDLAVIREMIDGRKF